MMLGYWKKPEETAKAMRGDWLLTGDIGHRDADGYYYITDRKKDMLLNGINVYPRGGRGSDPPVSRREGDRRHRHSRRAQRVSNHWLWRSRLRMA